MSPGDGDDGKVLAIGLAVGSLVGAALSIALDSGYYLAFGVSLGLLLGAAAAASRPFAVGPNRGGGRRVKLKAFWVGYAVLMVVFAASLWTWTDARDTGPSGGPLTVNGAPVPPPAREAEGLLGDLGVAPADPTAGYSPEDFPRWAGAASSGWAGADDACDAREMALMRDAWSIEVWTNDCSVADGEWLDPYTGSILRDPSGIAVDHVVPLAEAWGSGASGWTAKRRERYANAPSVVLTVAAEADRAKEDKGPEEWKPPKLDHRCEYARRWVSIKSGWGLSVDAAERDSLAGMLDRCGPGGPP